MEFGKREKGFHLALYFTLNESFSSKYFLSRNGSALVAFTVGDSFSAGDGYVILAAHSDSPCLKVKPVSRMKGPGGYNQLDVACYGGGLWGTWFDRDLFEIPPPHLHIVNGEYHIYISKCVMW